MMVLERKVPLHHFSAAWWQQPHHHSYVVASASLKISQSLDKDNNEEEIDPYCGLFDNELKKILDIKE